MSRPWQKFVAPGFDGQTLPIKPSPWDSGRWVRLPREHWDLILNFASKLDMNCAAKLQSLSWASNDNDMDYVNASSDDLKSMLIFINQLATAINQAEPLITKVTDDIPDIYPNEEHIRMLKAVSAVLSESIKLKQPFRAWSE